MSINIRRVTEATLQPNQVQSIHIAAGAVIEDKIGIGAVTNAKLADDGISTAKLQNAVVTLAKASDDVRMHEFVGEESEIFIQGTTWEIVKTARFVKGPSNPLSKMRFIGSLKTSVAGMTAHLGIDIDTVNKLDLTSTDTIYELVTGEFDVSALTTGRHNVDVKLKSEEAAESAFNDHVDIMFVK